MKSAHCALEGRERDLNRIYFDIISWKWKFVAQIEFYVHGEVQFGSLGQLRVKDMLKVIGWFLKARWLKMNASMLKYCPYKKWTCCKAHNNYILRSRHGKNPCIRFWLWNFTRSFFFFFFLRNTKKLLNFLKTTKKPFHSLVSKAMSRTWSCVRVNSYIIGIWQCLWVRMDTKMTHHNWARIRAWIIICILGSNLSINGRTYVIPWRERESSLWSHFHRLL